MGERPRPRRSAACGLVIAIAGAGVIGYLIARPHTAPPGVHAGPVPPASPLAKSPVAIWPASTDGYSVADDLATQQIVVFGGLAHNSATWLWDGSRWALAQPQ